MNVANLSRVPSQKRNIMTEPLYVCPDCKTKLQALFCPDCKTEFPTIEGVPRLLSRNPRFHRAEGIAAAYDSIYAVRTRVWEPQGRTPEFLQYFSSLLAGFPGKRMLEIGCGEGYLLASARTQEKFAVDLSMEALRKAKQRVHAHYSLALAERLPFPDDYFDIVTSVGVMEHFLDTGEALREIRRILKPGGHYVTLTHVKLTGWEKLRLVGSDFLLPRPRPLKLLGFMLQKARTRLVHNRSHPRQPIQNRYTTQGAKAWLARSGFVVRAVLHKRSQRNLPLIGPSVVIYAAEK
jgi:ubiquinone/menaquinone biosynthesis C-methylase UbiE